MKELLTAPFVQFQHSLHSIRLFKFKGIFMAILISMISLCLALCVIFSLFFTNTFIKNTNQQYLETNQAFLNTIVNNEDYLIKNLHQSLTQLSYTHDIFTLAFSTQINKEKAMNNANLSMSTLALTAENNALVKSSVLYIPSLGNVITSAYSTAPVDDYVYSDLIQSYEERSLPITLVEYNNTISTLFSFENLLVLAKDFPLTGAKRLATLYYYIDTHELYRQLTGSIAKGTHIWVYDAQNQPVFSKEAKYPSAITSETISRFETSSAPYMSDKQHTTFFVVSKITGWKYFYVVDDASLQPSAEKLFSILFPIILIVLVSASLASLLIASNIYRPFHSLLSAIDDNRNPFEQTDAFKNEVDYLTYTFSIIEDHQFKLDHMMRNVSQDVISRLFLDLLSGAQISVIDAEEILTKVQSPFLVNASYIACALQFSNEVSLTENRRSVILSDLKTITDTLNRKYETLSHIITINPQTFSIILSFSQPTNVMSIKKELVDLESAVNSMPSAKDAALLFGAGHLYNSLLDVGFSHMEALSELASQAKFQENDISPTNTPSDSNWSTRTEQLLSLIINNDLRGAEVLLERILNEIFNPSMSKETSQKNYECFITAFTDRILKLEYVDPTCLYIEWLIPNDQQIMLDSESLSSAMKEACFKLIAELAKILKRQHNRFIVAAQEYISRHFDDSNLSLNSISETIGTNSSYLSRLFKDNLGINFTDYLNSYRVERSISFIKSSDDSIKDIAVQSGFSSVQNYIRVFKKHTGTTPGQYRDDNLPHKYEKPVS